MIKQNVSSYNTIAVMNRKSDVKPHESKLSKAYNRYIDGIFYYYYYSSYPDVWICDLTSQRTYIHIGVKQDCYWKPTGVSTKNVYSGSRAFPVLRLMIVPLLEDRTYRKAYKRVL